MAEKIAIIDYGSGNLRSAEKSCERVIATHNLNADVFITNRADDIRGVDRIILPGQGAFGDCMQGLRAVDGMIDALSEAVLQQGKPFLGICVGMQLLVDQGREFGIHEGLGWISGIVKPIEPADASLKIPHIGWNDTYFTDMGQSHSMLQGITESSGQAAINYYFVHSFMVDCKDTDHILAKTEYGQDVTAVIGRDNIIGAQFHPEKSHNAGLDLIHSFIKWSA